MASEIGCPHRQKTRTRRGISKKVGKRKGKREGEEEEKESKKKERREEYEEGKAVATYLCRVKTLGSSSTLSFCCDIALI